MAEVRARAITKLFRAKSTMVEAVKSLDMDIRDGEFVVFVGPSGSGKSTFLRLVAGLELPNSGHLYIGNREVTTTHPRARGVAMVFQDYALYPHMSVRENMSFALENLKRPREEIKRRVNDAASMLRISDLLERRPRELSGGQRQRVAVGRAIVRQPEAFLFDEPLSNLDAILRVQMRVELADLHRRLGTTSIYVTHDQVEAMTLGQRIVVMNYGAIQQVGTSAELYDSPANTFVASFIGSPPMNMLAGRLEQTGGGLALVLDGAQILLPPSVAQRYASYAGREVQFGLRPENITMPHSPLAAGALSVAVPVRLLIVENLGAEKLVHFTIGEQPCVARMPVDAPISGSGEVQLGFTLTKMHLFDRTTGLALLPRAND